MAQETPVYHRMGDKDNLRDAAGGGSRPFQRMKVGEISRDANFPIPCIYPIDEVVGGGEKFETGGMGIKSSKLMQL